MPLWAWCSRGWEQKSSLLIKFSSTYRNQSKIWWSITILCTKFVKHLQCVMNRTSKKYKTGCPILLRDKLPTDSNLIAIPNLKQADPVGQFSGNHHWRNAADRQVQLQGQLTINFIWVNTRFHLPIQRYSQPASRTYSPLFVVHWKSRLWQNWVTSFKHNHSPNLWTGQSPSQLTIPVWKTNALQAARHCWLLLLHINHIYANLESVRLRTGTG